MVPRCPIAAIVLLVLAIVTTGCEEDKKVKLAEPPPQQVIVSLPTVQDITPYWSYTGTLDGFETVEIRPRVNGFLDQIGYEAGALVKDGQHLFTVDPRPYQAAVAQAKADVEAKIATLAQAEYNLQMKVELAKKQAASQFEVTNQTAIRDQAKAALDAANAQLDNANLNLGWTNVTSPVTGIITRNLVDRGALVGPTSLLATVIDQSKVYAYFNMSEADLLEILESHEVRTPLRDIKPDQRPKVELARTADKGYPYTGRIDSVDNKVDSGTGTITIRAVFENNKNELVPGMFVRVRIPDEKRKAILVPQTAISSDQAGQYVLVVGQDNVVQRRYLKLGMVEGTLREVTDGLTPEDRFVVTGIQKVRAGAKVAPKDVNDPSLKDAKPTLNAPMPAGTAADAKPADAKPEQAKPAEKK